MHKRRAGAPIPPQSASSAFSQPPFIRAKLEEEDERPHTPQDQQSPPAEAAKKSDRLTRSDKRDRAEKLEVKEERQKRAKSTTRRCGTATFLLKLYDILEVVVRLNAVEQDGETRGFVE
jgi:hypothetical protein